MIDCNEIMTNLLLGSKLVPISYLKEQNVDVAICMAPENEVPDMEDITFYRFPVSFMANDNISRENMIKAKNKCVELLKDGKKIFLHCVAGFNRSPAVTAMILSEFYKISIHDAVEFINYFRIIAPEKHLALLHETDVIGM